ncbi:desumoylating isopeptidase 1-like [Tribolium madens]|uniref:desumoylating isopeptidase 1-like n=1 Tax=Tribolium madens TaxID=41895 RepID=UPI001CF74B89|nr:desumoylating isopeptidase 1-like [Tribolium madens]XP_044253715.1 desumoylating isopeptidase 1-like [Tribolium madens]
MGAPVLLYMYDLSDGWCRNLGPLCPVNAVWHTSIVLYGNEYVFGSTGIIFHKPGKPDKIIELGETDIAPFDFKIYVKELKYTEWTGTSYDPFKHNCNHFTDHIARFLGVGPIPECVFTSVDKLRESPFYSKIVDWVTKNGQNQQK